MSFPFLQGDPGDLFYIIKEGEAVVYQDSGSGSSKRVNQLFKADFFGEGALLSDEPRWMGNLALAVMHGLNSTCKEHLSSAALTCRCVCAGGQAWRRSRRLCV